jgi:hypothetical protein
MRPFTKTLSATGSTNWLPINYSQNAFNIGVQVVVSGGASLVWIVEITNDDIYNPAVTPVATVAPAPLDTGTATEVGNITIPCRAIRLTATITSGTATMTAIQGRS